jgi:hypothetical protein
MKTDIRRSEPAIVAVNLSLTEHVCYDIGGPINPEHFFRAEGVAGILIRRRVGRYLEAAPEGIQEEGRHHGKHGEESYSIERLPQP